MLQYLAVGLPVYLTFEVFDPINQRPNDFLALNALQGAVKGLPLNKLEDRFGVTVEVIQFIDVTRIESLQYPTPPMSHPAREQKTITASRPRRPDTVRFI